MLGVPSPEKGFSSFEVTLVVRRWRLEHLNDNCSPLSTSGRCCVAPTHCGYRASFSAVLQHIRVIHVYANRLCAYQSTKRYLTPFVVPLPGL